MKIAIIGTGAAGIAAALKLSQAGGHEIQLFDANQKIGRKLFATGNGRCNITNIHASPTAYYSREPQDLSPVLDRFTPEIVREFLDLQGIPTVITEGGWVYPQSFSAANVVQILASNLAFAGIQVNNGQRIRAIRADAGRFFLSTEEKNLAPFDRILVASGGKAFPQLGAHSEVLQELEKLGHYNIPFSPALSPVVLKANPLKGLAGVRLDAQVTLFKDETALGSSFGNIILTDFGLNGPGAMNISHLIEEENSVYKLQLNFIPGELCSTLEKVFYARIKSAHAYRSVFLSVLPEKMVDFMFMQWKIPGETRCSAIDSRTFRIHTKKIQEYQVSVEGIKGFNYSQAAAGGIRLSEIDLNSMQSRLASGLFFAGEVLDVLGPCGGYNLHWALASGLCAAEGIAA